MNGINAGRVRTEFWLEIERIYRQNLLYTRHIIRDEKLQLSEKACKQISMGTVFTLSIRTPQLLTIYVLNLNQYNSLPDVVSKKCWMSGKQCRPR